MNGRVHSINLNPKRRVNTVMKNNREPALPFAGLGLSLDGVHERARRLVLRRVDFPVEERRPAPATFVPVRAGYDLLLGLSREIRGR